MSRRETDRGRRDWLRRAGSTMAGLGVSACFARAGAAGPAIAGGRSIIVLRMKGGPSQFETFSPKPGRETGGPTGAISTAVPGIEVAEHWPRVAASMDRFTLIRSMTGVEADHDRAGYLLETGFAKRGALRQPSFVANMLAQRGGPVGDLPRAVAVDGRPIGTAAYLGAAYDPFGVEEPGKLPPSLRSGVDRDRFGRRDALRRRLSEAYELGGAAARSHAGIYDAASELMLSDRLDVFTFEDEPESIKTAYGDGKFGRGCLLARRLVERGVAFVQVQSDGWDTHLNGFERTAELAGQVDGPTATLVNDLASRGLLENTLVLWAGEFGRTPAVDGAGGRNHYARAYNVLVAGGGVRGGQVIGKTDADGIEVTDRPVTVPDLLRSLCVPLGLDPDHETVAPDGRPFKMVDEGEVVEELFA